MIDGVLVGRPRTGADTRGEVARLDDGPSGWARVLASRTRRGGVRGLHVRHGTWRLLWVAAGEIADVVVDLRADRHRVQTVRLSADGDSQVLVPPGCAHGFQALSEQAVVVLCSSGPADDGGVRADDPDLAIAWPLPPLLDGRDAELPLLHRIAPGSTRRNGDVPSTGRRQ